MNPSILFVSHEATLTGAPILLFNLIQELRPLLDQEIIVVLGKDGPLRPKFEQVATVILYEQPISSRLQAALLRRLGSSSDYQAHRFRRQLRGKNIQLIFSNTIATGRFIQALQLPAEIPLVTYVHELRFTMEMQQFVYGDVNWLLHRTTYFLAGSDAVRQELLRRNVSPSHIQIVFSSVRFAELQQRIAAADVVNVRQELSLSKDTQLVIAVGTANWRKGNDWFVEMSARLGKQYPKLHFAWVGASPGTLEHMQMSHDVAQYGLANQFTLVPVTPAYLNYLVLADVFVLSSREDPFPLVVLEAAVAGKPTVCFAQAGGAPEFVGELHGAVVPYGDVEALSDAVGNLLTNSERARSMGVAAREAVRTTYSTDSAAAQIGQLLNRLMIGRA